MIYDAAGRCSHWLHYPWRVGFVPAVENGVLESSGVGVLVEEFGFLHFGHGAVQIFVDTNRLGLFRDGFLYCERTVGVEELLGVAEPAAEHLIVWNETWEAGLCLALSGMLVDESRSGTWNSKMRGHRKMGGEGGERVWRRETSTRAGRALDPDVSLLLSIPWND